MAGDIIKELYRVFVVKQITGFISNAITSAFPSLGATPMKAIGGPVQRGNPYVVGERGPELFVPSRSGSIVSNDNMSGGGGVTVVQNINVSTGVQQTVRTEIKSLMPQIAESAKAAVADAKRRGGSYGRAFA
jgi:phage-related minor tail protein